MYKWRHYGDDSIEELNNFIVNCNVMNRYLLNARCLVPTIAATLQRGDVQADFMEGPLFSMVFYIIYNESAFYAQAGESGVIFRGVSCFT